MVDRYGEAIEADLQDIGVDLLDVWRGRVTPRRVLNLIEQMPATCRWREQEALDEEIAEIHAASIDPDAETTAGRAVVPLSQFDLTAQLLTLIGEQLGELTAIVVAALGDGKVKHPPPYPRPETALQRLLRERADAALESNLQSLLDAIEAARERESPD